MVETLCKRPAGASEVGKRQNLPKEDEWKIPVEGLPGWRDRERIIMGIRVAR